MNTPESKSLRALHEQEFVRERWTPQPGDAYYLALSDLRLALDQVATAESIRVLDFGAGGSPYRALFPNADYMRADFEGATDLTLNDDGTVPAQPETFDLILSTQVLEHCKDPHGYLRECARLLKVGGRLVLTTHGLFEEHACPHDYQRWTQAGLEHLFVINGFDVVRSRRLTAGPRGGVFLFDRSMRGVKSLDVSLPWSFLWRVFRRMWFGVQSRRDKLMDHLFAGLRVVEDATPRGAATYVGIFVEGRKRTSL